MENEADRLVVYRGSDVVALDLVEGLLQTEGFEPERLGRTSPALMGGGETAFTQMITVPADWAEAARALIEQADVAGPPVDDLEAQALAAKPIEN